MIFVSIGRSQEEFYALRSATRFSVLDRPNLGQKKLAFIQQDLEVPPHIADPRSVFPEIAKQLAQWAASDDVTVLVSRSHPMNLNPLKNEGLESLIAMLILSFPDVNWVFCTLLGHTESGDKINNKIIAFERAHGLYNLFQPRQSTIFDGQGLRDWVRACTQEADTTADTTYLPRRKQLAIGLDEEIDYAYLHAYIAYRFGFRALAISTQATAEAVLGENSSWQAPAVLLEDLFLNFPDGNRASRLSKLDTARHLVFPKLQDAEHRIIVTTGQRVAGDNTRKIQNKHYVLDQRANGKSIQFLFKPHGGIFDVWKKSGLLKKLRWKEVLGGKVGKTHRGTAKEFVWPPDWRQIEHDRIDSGDADGSGHSSPGVLLQISRHLLDRSELILRDGISTVEKAVRGAVFSNEALELLGGKTPTTAAEALSLKHQFELHAECQFAGVEQHVQVQDRFIEIKRDAESIARWFRPQESLRASLNIQMNIANQLVQSFQQYNQFDEEQQCLSHVRNLQNSLYMHERKWRFVFWPLLRYSEFLLSSFSKFIFAMVIWLVSLTLLFDFLRTPQPIGAAANLSDFGYAIGTFLGVAPYPSVVWLSAIAIVSGLAHLGIFISHMYSLVSRR